MGEYSGRTVVLTGAGSGLGAAMADLFAEAGASIALLDIDAANAEAKAAELRERGHEAAAFHVDVARKESLVAAAEGVKERFGGCHVLCANVGVQQFGAADVLSDQDWQWVLSVNVLGVINTVNSFLPMIRAAKGDRQIVITSSASVFQGGARMGAYVTSKYAVTGYAEVLRQELAAEDINVTMVFPAGMSTNHLKSSMAARPSELGQSRFDPADVQAMLASAEINVADHVLSPDEAVSRLLDELRARNRYMITHGGYRPQVEAQQQEVLAAFDRMSAGMVEK